MYKRQVNSCQVRIIQIVDPAANVIEGLCKDLGSGKVFQSHRNYMTSEDFGKVTAREYQGILERTGFKLLNVQVGWTLERVAKEIVESDLIR